MRFVGTPGGARERVLTCNSSPSHGEVQRDHVASTNKITREKLRTGLEVVTKYQNTVHIKWSTASKYGLYECLHPPVCLIEKLKKHAKDFESPLSK